MKTKFLRHVLLITHDSLNGGTGRSAYELACLLNKESNVKPIVICYAENSLSKALRDRGIETYCTKFGYTVSWHKNAFCIFFKSLLNERIKNVLAYRFLRKKIDLSEIDIIHTNSGAISFGAFLKRKTQKPHVWHLREYFSFLQNCGVQIKDLPNYVLSNSDTIISVSEAVKKNWNLHEQKKCKTVYDGVRSFSADKKNKSSSLLKIAFCGRLNDFKGQKHLLKAICSLPQEKKSILQADFYGTGEASYEAYLKNLVRQYDLEGCCNFKGYESNIQEKLIEYDVGVNLSRSEGFGRTTVEYMLAGLYVIAYNTGATSEIIQNEQLGKLLEYGDIDGLHDALEHCIANRNQIKKIAENGKKYALENFCIENNYRNILTIYDEVLNEKA